MYKRGIIMTTAEIVLITILCTLFVPVLIVGGISYISECFTKKTITYTVFYKDTSNRLKFMMTDVKKIKFKKDLVYIKWYDIEEKHYVKHIIKKEYFREAIKNYA